jgi:hypothetical protein
LIRPRADIKGFTGDAAPRPDADVRHIDINFARLKARGFVTPDAGSSQIAEEFRVIKRPIIRNAVGRGAVKHGNLVMVTSALPSEGKTFTSLNLALSIATEIDSTVLLVDGDVAHPSIPEIIGAPHGPGLLDLLTRDDLDFGDALVKTNIEKLSLLPAGTRHRRSTELLASEQMASLLREISKRPILGMVSMLPSETLFRKQRRRSWLFAGGLAGLFAAFGAVFAFALLVGRVA